MKEFGKVFARFIFQILLFCFLIVYLLFGAFVFEQLQIRVQEKAEDIKKNKTQKQTEPNMMYNESIAGFVEHFEKLWEQRFAEPKTKLMRLSIKQLVESYHRTYLEFQRKLENLVSEYEVYFLKAEKDMKHIEIYIKKSEMVTENHTLRNNVTEKIVGASVWNAFKIKQQYFHYCFTIVSTFGCGIEIYSSTYVQLGSFLVFAAFGIPLFWISVLNYARFLWNFFVLFTPCSRHCPRHFCTKVLLFFIRLILVLSLLFLYNSLGYFFLYPNTRNMPIDGGSVFSYKSLYVFNFFQCLKHCVKNDIELFILTLIYVYFGLVLLALLFWLLVPVFLKIHLFMSALDKPEMTLNGRPISIQEIMTIFAQKQLEEIEATYSELRKDYELKAKGKIVPDVKKEFESSAIKLKKPSLPTIEEESIADAAAALQLLTACADIHEPKERLDGPRQPIVLDLEPGDTLRFVQSFSRIHVDRVKWGEAKE